MRIDVIIDTVCPWCFIGKRRLERALKNVTGVAVELVWRPFQLNPEIPKQGRSHHSYLTEKFGGMDRAASRYGVIRDAGRSEGIHFDFDAIDVTPNSLDSHRLLAYSERHGMQTPLVEAMFQAYFLEGRDIGDRAVLADIAAKHGLNREEIAGYLDSEVDIDRIRAEDDMIRRMGVNGVPCYIVNGKYAISGAQSPEVFFQVFDLVRHEDPQVAAE
jgi:predicted DsbA family dithiol-disulfide isomerase